MKVIRDKIFPNERDLYGAKNLQLINCTFDGQQNGESALKEAQNVCVRNCTFALRYPLWHDVGLDVADTTFTQTCRAALWYSRKITLNSSNLLGIKALRECNGAQLTNCTVVSPEFGWRSRNVMVSGGRIDSEYLFLNARNVTLEGVQFNGKYSFQYTQGVTVDNSVLNTKDAFWHARNVTVRNSTVKGEYLGWYSNGLTFVNCTIEGTQPLCYCKNLTLINCRMVNTDLSFEYSQVDAQIDGAVLSVKNPRSGTIVADAFGEIILTDDSKYPSNCKVIARKSK